MPEKKAPAKSSAPKSKPKSAAKSAKATATGEKSATATARISTRGACTADKCQQPLRAKGYCRKHFLAWRRTKLGTHHHYKICGKEACRKKREFGGLCAEHAGKGEAAQAAAAAS